MTLSNQRLAYLIGIADDAAIKSRQICAMPPALRPRATPPDMMAWIEAARPDEMAEALRELLKLRQGF